MSSIEDKDYRHPDGPRRTRLRANWSAARIKRAGADVCKLLWFYRPDAIESSPSSSGGSWPTSPPSTPSSACP